jgi:hypothetical protein
VPKQFSGTCDRKEERMKMLKRLLISLGGVSALVMAASAGFKN